MPASDDTESPTRLALLNRAVQRLKAAERDAPRRVAAWLLMEVIGEDQGQLYAHPGREVAPNEARQFNDMVQRCVAGEPLQHVLGYAVFRGLRLQVSPAVMVPRPETEEVVEAALEMIDDSEAPRVLDVGTGSGCIALTIKHERPEAAVQAWDVSADALAVARENATQLGLDVQFAEVDFLAEGGGDRLSDPVDLLVSNPPYIPDDEAESLPAVVRDYDPHVALFAGDDPMRFYRAIAGQASALCAPDAGVVLETHADYAEEAAAVLRNEGLDDVRLQKDLSGRLRILTARYRAG